MSHVAKIKTAITDLLLVRKVSEELGYAFDSEIKTHKIYTTAVEGASLRFPGWTYPVVLMTTGELAYDHYNGHWGNPEHLSKFLHEYTTQATLQDLQMAGMSGYVASTETNQAGQRLTRICMV
jgi:CheY-like chemotaxis protein